MPAAAAWLQSCPTLCDPIDGSPPGSPVPGVLQARTMEWVAVSFSNAWKWKVKVKSLSHVRLFATPWTAAYQAPPSMGFSRQERVPEWGAIVTFFLLPSFSYVNYIIKYTYIIYTYMMKHIYNVLKIQKQKVIFVMPTYQWSQYLHPTI